MDNAEELLSYADGVIVGTSLKYDGVTENPVDEKRVKQLMEVIYKLRKRKNIERLGNALMQKKIKVNAILAKN